MVTLFNRKDLVLFGEYMMSENRKRRFEETFKEKKKAGEKNPLPVDEAIQKVYHADIENWIFELKNK